MKAQFIALFATLAALHAAPAPPAPTGLVAYVPQGQVTAQVLRVCLAWQDNARSEKAYTVERSLCNPTTGEWTAFETIANLPRNAVNWTDYAPVWGIWAAYRVVAVGQQGESISNVAFYRLN